MWLISTQICFESINIGLLWINLCCSIFHKSLAVFLLFVDSYVQRKGNWIALLQILAVIYRAQCSQFDIDGSVSPGSLFSILDVNPSWGLYSLDWEYFPLTGLFVYQWSFHIVKVAWFLIAGSDNTKDTLRSEKNISGCWKAVK